MSAAMRRRRRRSGVEIDRDHVDTETIELTDDPFAERTTQRPVSTTRAGR